MEPANKGQTYPVELLTRAEVHALMANLGRGVSGDRYRAAVVLMYRCGLRVSEALALEPKDVDLHQGTVTVLRGKGNRRRTVGIDPQAAAVLEKWIRRRRQLGAGARGPVICQITHGRIGRPVYASVLRDALSAAAARAGITKRVHPHQLRHGFASELAREGVSLPLIQRLLGHRSLATTQRYLGGLSDWDAIDAVRSRASWAELRGSRG